MTDQVSDKKVVIIGGGPAGLTAAYELTKLDLVPVVLEKQDKVGGLARTEEHKGFRFDMGGHRFFSKVEEVKKMWREILGDNFLHRPRLSRIYYRKKFVYYPLKPLNALMGLGLFGGLIVMLSYVRWRLFPCQNENTFEQWVTNRFGKRLFLTFFKDYAEKVWGIPCSELKAEWAAQRINGLCMKTALLDMFRKSKRTITTLIDEFDYPRLGPGMMWDAVKGRIETRGGSVRLETEVLGINRKGLRIDSVVVSCNGSKEIVQGTDFISSMPITEFIKKLEPSPPAAVPKAAEKLRYRDFLTVCLIVNKPYLFPDNWIYIHEPKVKVCRIQNFKNWNPEMVPDPAKTSLGLEYFCTEGDELWSMADSDLIDVGKRELARIGLASYADIEEGRVFRLPKSYPVYDSDYRESLAVIKEFVDRLENLQTIGRNGLHRYNNQDHAMLTGMLAVRNLVFGEKNDLWSINTSQEYHEEIRRGGESRVRDVVEAIEGTLSCAFPKLHRVAFGLALGLTAGILPFVATLILVLNGGGSVGPHLQLLSDYIPGYSVTAAGSVVALAYGFAFGFTIGSGFAFLRNAAMLLYVALSRRRAEKEVFGRLLDYL